MYHYSLHQHIEQLLELHLPHWKQHDEAFYTRFMCNAATLLELYKGLYNGHPAAENEFDGLLICIINAHKQRDQRLKKKDSDKQEKGKWFLSQELAGMSLYVDRFCGQLSQLPDRFDYLQTLGVNLLHLMPLFETPPDESDGGYAVSDFRKVNKRLGTLDQLITVQQELDKRGMHLMLDIVLNHTSDKHIWAQQAKEGNPVYQDYYYFFPDRQLPDQYDAAMPEIFPEAAPGNFTFIPETGRWVMTAFHNYQWDLNYSNPRVLIEMLDNIFFYANLGVDILRIDAPAFIWKQAGTTCQNLPQAHELLQLIRHCVEVAAPGMALLGEAIVAPAAIMNYFGTGRYIARECDFAYNATQMALQWDMLATGDTRVMLAAQTILGTKPAGSSWITYTRCHDDIGLGYDDEMIRHAGFDPYAHRSFIKDYYAGSYPASAASGALFSSNPRTGDARISGTLASLCGLEKAVRSSDKAAIELAVQKILLMQAHSFFIGGLPMLYYGDEVGYTNDYSYETDPARSYDNRWMHRPEINWARNALCRQNGSVEHYIYEGTQTLLSIRKKLEVVADHSNIRWIRPHNIHVAGYVRENDHNSLYALFNFSGHTQHLTWHAFREKAEPWTVLKDLWSGQLYTLGADNEYLSLPPYAFFLFQPVNITTDNV